MTHSTELAHDQSASSLNVEHSTTTPITASAFDDPQIDYSAPEIREALKRAYYVLLKYRAIRLSKQAKAEEALASPRPDQNPTTEGLQQTASSITTD